MAYDSTTEVTDQSWLSRLGGGTRTTTTYSYDKAWSERPIDSGGFHDPGGHENPGSMPWQSAVWTADRVTGGPSSCRRGWSRRSTGGRSCR